RIYFQRERESCQAIRTRADSRSRDAVGGGRNGKRVAARRPKIRHSRGKGFIPRAVPNLFRRDFSVIERTKEILWKVRSYCLPTVSGMFSRRVCPGPR